MLLEDRLSFYISSRYPEAVVSNLNFLVSGYETEIYTFDLRRSDSSPKNFILRLFSGEGAAQKLIREARALSFLQKAGYPVPALLLQETEPGILGQPFEIIQRLEGQSLWPVLATAESHQQAQLLSRFGSLLAQLHRLDWRPCMENPEAYEKKPVRWLEEIIAHYRSLYTKHDLKGFLQILNWLDIHKYEITVQPAVVHQDFHANNVFLGSNDELSVIDWTQFAVSDYRIDLCWTLLIMGDLGNPDWKEKILDGYTSGFNDTLQGLDYFNVIVTMKLLASTVISLKFGPETLGLRTEAVELTKEQISIYKQLAQRIRTITGLAIPELESLLERV